MHASSRVTLLASLLALVVATPAASQPGTGNCAMGETRDPTFGVPGLYGKGITLYQWFDPADCNLCVSFGRAIQIKTVELQVIRSISVNWTIEGTASVIGWTGTTDCPVPDESVVLMAPQAVTFPVPFSHGLATVACKAPLLNSPPLFQPAFLKLEFTPVLTTPVVVEVGQIDAPGCTTCRQYVTATEQGLVMADACSAGGGALFPWVVRPRGDCVDRPVAARTGSWGRVKAFYK